MFHSAACAAGSLARRAEDETVTLLCGCKDADHCHRTILKELVETAGDEA